ncbi:MAG: YihY/virulence factor BrkB family protein [Caldicoprobacterales bacterium]|jgi:membrane protein|nr:YihY/virulence factor BrkB family protein [Clostridiales bacterium]
MIFYIRELYRRYIDDEVAAYGAEMAYYFLLSVFPFLIFLTTVIGYLPLDGSSILDSLSDILPQISYEMLRDNVEQIINRRNFKLLSFSFASMLWAAASGMGAVMRGINKALCQKDTRPFWIAIPLSLLFTLMVTVLILSYFALLIFGRQIGAGLMKAGPPRLHWLIWDLFRHGIAVLMMILVFVFLYRYSPCIKIRWRSALPGAIFTTAGWLMVSWIFAWYVNRFWNLSLVYGSIGGIIGLLVWLFISAQLIIMGGELNAVLIFHRKSKIEKRKSLIRKKKSTVSYKKNHRNETNQ